MAFGYATVAVVGVVVLSVVRGMVGRALGARAAQDGLRASN
jgi:hypothetical protein